MVQAPTSIAETARRAIIVLGMHRSGTSALAGALGLLGGRLPARMMPPWSSNLKGHFEPEYIVAIHDRALLAAGSSWSSFDALRADWFQSAAAVGFADELVEAVRQDYADAALFIVKDPRMCRLMPLWRRVLQKLGARSSYVILFRHPTEVAQSLEKRDGLSLAEGYLLWVRHLLEAERDTRGAQRLFLRYADLLENPTGITDRITSQLIEERHVDEEKRKPVDVETFIEPAMRHHLAEEEEINVPAYSFLRLHDIYEAYKVLARCPDDEQAQRQLDDIRATFDVAVTAFHPLLARKAETIADREARIAALSNQVKTLGQALAARDAEIAFMQTKVSALFASRSWRATAPLRNAGRFLRRVGNRSKCAVVVILRIVSRGSGKHLGCSE